MSISRWASLSAMHQDVRVLTLEPHGERYVRLVAALSAEGG